MEETEIDKLRNNLIKLREERGIILLEKGVAADENKDLRENSTYDYWYEKGMVVTSRIYHITRMIEDLSRKNRPVKKVKTKKPCRIKESFEPHKWL